MGDRDEIRNHHFMEHAAAATSLVNQGNARHALQECRIPFYYDNRQYYPYGYYYPPEEAKFIGIIPWTLKMLKLLAIGFLLLSSSIVLYGLFYWSVMPGNYASRPLFFDYTGTVVFPHNNVALDPNLPHEYSKASTAQVASSSSASSPSNSNTQTNNERTCMYTPWATVDLFAREQAVTLGETIHQDLLPPQETKDRILQPKQAYYVEVHLTLPETELNRQLGMFGVAVDLLSHSSVNGTTLKLASSVRSSRLPHESGWLAVARKLLWMVPIILGGMQESQVVVIPSFRHIVESKDYPLRHVVVRLVAQTSHLSNGMQQSEQPNPPVEVIGGEVRIGKELNAWQQVLKDWYYTCYAVGTLILFFVHLGCGVIMKYYFTETEDFEEPYFDPSCDFDDMGPNNDNDFESIQHGDDDEEEDDNGNRSVQRSSAGRSGNASGEPSNMEQSNNGNADENNSTPPLDEDENSENWEECAPEDGATSVQGNGLYSLADQERDLVSRFRSAASERDRKNKNSAPLSMGRSTSSAGPSISREIDASTAIAGKGGRKELRKTKKNKAAVADVTTIESSASSNPTIPVQLDNTQFSKAKSCEKTATTTTTSENPRVQPGQNDIDKFFECFEDIIEDPGKAKNWSNESPSLLAVSGVGFSASTGSSANRKQTDDGGYRELSGYSEQIGSPPIREVCFPLIRPLHEPSSDCGKGSPLTPVFAQGEGKNSRDLSCSLNVAETDGCEYTVLAMDMIVAAHSADQKVTGRVSSAEKERYAGVGVDRTYDPCTNETCCESSETGVIRVSCTRKQSTPLCAESVRSSSRTELSCEEPNSRITQCDSCCDVIFQLPEAQILDSFLHDLISPFVR